MIRGKTGKSRLFFILFICLALIQIYIPASTIIKHERVLKNGELFKFKAIPVDPYDPFRGRYVSISLENFEFFLDEDSGLLMANQTVYVTLGKDEQGFAVGKKMLREKPEEEPYLKTKISYLAYDTEFNGDIIQKEAADEPENRFSKAIVQVPFDRYYMAEKVAPEAEKAYLENVSGKEGDAYISVRILSGMGVIEKLYIKGMPIEDLLKAQAQPAG